MAPNYLRADVPPLAVVVRHYVLNTETNNLQLTTHRLTTLYLSHGLTKYTNLPNTVTKPIYYNEKGKWNNYQYRQAMNGECYNTNVKVTI